MSSHKILFKKKKNKKKILFTFLFKSKYALKRKKSFSSLDSDQF